ncbi:hypothetical protein [Bartonella sp. CB60]|uniref:hypothetical protein n=1 Tax=Bartonella sp. CB60 TaxID=3113619 RepID=UPI00300E366F
MYDDIETDAFFASQSSCPALTQQKRELLKDYAVYDMYADHFMTVISALSAMLAGFFLQEIILILKLICDQNQWKKNAEAAVGIMAIMVFLAISIKWLWYLLKKTRSREAALWEYIKIKSGNFECRGSNDKEKKQTWTPTD